MSEPVFQVPSTSVFLHTDGLVLADPSDGVEVLEATLDDAPTLTAAFVGQGLQMMSADEWSLGDAFFDGVGASTETRHAVKSVVELTESLVLIGDAIELGVKIADWMGLLGPPDKDPLLVILERVDSRLNQIEDAVLQSWAASRRDSIAFLRAHSSAALRFAQEYLELGRPHDPIWEAKLALADRDSLVATQTFVASGIDGGYWRRPASLKAIIPPGRHQHETWFHFYPHKDQLVRDPVWDYRFALPAAAYAIAARIAVLKAVAPDSLEEGRAGCREVKGYANFLRKVAERMQDGIWAVKDLDMSEPAHFQFLWRGYAPVMAADIYTGHSLFRILYASEWEYLRREHPSLWPPGLVEPHQLGNTEAVVKQGRENVRRVGEHWWALVYRGIGMIELCQLISDVDAACTRPSPIEEWVNAAVKLYVASQTDVGNRRKASLAAGLAGLTSHGDPVAEAAHAFMMDRALHTREGQQVLLGAAEELLKFGTDVAHAED